MKKIKHVVVSISLTLIALFQINNVQAQWSWQNPMPDGNNKASVDFTDANTGYMAGELGNIQKTTDGGETWSTLTSGTTTNLSNIYFQSTDTGYVLGNGGMILKTVNAGATWTNLNSSITENLNSIFFINKNVGWAPAFGAVYKTTNGGATWTKYVLPNWADQSLYAVHFSDLNNGITVGSFGYVFKTTDGGLTWTSVYTGNLGGYTGIYFINSTTAILMGSDGIYKSTDGGSSFIKKSTITIQNPTSLKFINNTTGFCLVAGGIMKTTDGGETWAKTTSALYNYSNWDIIDANTYYNVAGNGLIQKTTDGGATWSEKSLAKRYDLYAIDFSTKTNGFAVGGTGLILNNNNGNTWTAQTSNTIQHLYDVQFTGIDTGYVVGAAGTILKTTNGGNTWVAETSGIVNDLKSVFFTSKNIGYASTDKGEVIKTTDAGATWVKKMYYDMYDKYKFFEDMYFTSDNKGFLVGAQNATQNGVLLYSTSDGGATWQSSVLPTQQKTIFFTDSLTGYMGGNSGIYKSVDGGTTWTLLNSGITLSINSIKFINSQVGYAMCNTGKIYKTTNAGDTWTVQETATSKYFYDGYFNGTTGYLVGTGGTILYTDNGGAPCSSMYLMPDICTNKNNATVTIIPKDGKEPFTYAWSNSVTNATTTFALNGTYTVTVTDSQSCTATAAIQLNNANVIKSTNTVTVCNGVEVVRGTHTYTTAGVYNDTLTTIYGCDSVVTTTVMVNPLPDVVFPTDLSVCTNVPVILNTTGVGTLTSDFNYDLSFNGTSDYIVLDTIKPLLNQQKFTIEAMVNTVYVNDGTILSLYENSSNAMTLKVVNNSIFMYFGNNIAYLSTYLPYSTWTHIAVVYDGTGSTNADKVKIYLNGVLQVAYFQGIIPAKTISNAKVFTIGASRDTANVVYSYYNALLNDVRLWNVNRSQAEILASMSSCLTGSETGLIANYGFNEGEGTTITSNTKNEFAGTLNMTNTAWKKSTKGCMATISSYKHEWSNGIKNNVEFIPSKTQTYYETVTDRFTKCAINDSVKITVNANSVEKNQTLKECEGYVLKIGSSTHTTSGVYEDFPTQGSCSSIITNLTINPRVYSTNEQVACNGQSIKIGTHTYTTSGTYIDTLVSAIGCDSIVTSKIVFTGPLFSINSTPANAEICLGDSIQLNTQDNSVPFPAVNTDLSFDGIDDYVVLPACSLLDNKANMTIEAMIYNTVDQGTILAKYVNGYNLLLGCGGNKIFLNIDNKTATTPSNFPLNKWIHVACVYNGAGVTNADKVKIYIDGVSQTLTFGGGNFLALTNATAGDYTIGSLKSPWNTLYKLTGKLNDVRLWTVSRTQSEIQASMNSCITGSETGLVANFNFDEAKGSKINSSTIVNTVGTLTKMDTVTAWNVSTVGCIGNAKYTYSYNWSNIVTANYAKPVITTSYVVTITNEQTGCSTKANKEVVVVGPVSTEDISICFGDSLKVGIHTYNKAGSYVDTIVTAQGCNTIRTTNLTIRPKLIPAIKGDTTFCSANNETTLSTDKYVSYSWIDGGGNVGTTQTINYNGAYSPLELTVVDSIGCTGVYMVNVIEYITPDPVIKVIGICEGSNYSVGSSVYTKSGVYVDTLISATGCDSIVTTILKVNTIPTALITSIPVVPVVCSGDSVTLNTPASIPSYALLFDSYNDYIALGDLPALNKLDKFTLEAMINVSSYGQGTIFYRENSTGGINLYLTSGILGMSVTNGSAGQYVECNIGDNFNTDTWVHIAAVFDATVNTYYDKEMKIYINGTLQKSWNYVDKKKGYVNGIMPDTTPTIVEDAYIGRTNYGFDLFGGQLNDFRIWNTARTASEIASSVNSCLNGTETGLIANYTFNVGMGNTVSSNTSYNYTGTLMNMLTKDPDGDGGFVTRDTCWVKSQNGCSIPEIIYTWSDGIVNGSAFVPVPNHTYKVTVTDGSTGCASSAEVNLTVNSIDATTTLTGVELKSNQAGATYQWLNCNDTSSIANETNETYTAFVNGDYSVLVSLNGCSDTSACVNINTVGLSTFGNSNEFSIYPNPTNGNVLITSPTSINKLKVLDVTGQIVLNKINLSANATIDLSSFANGVYYIQVLTNKEISTTKLVKQ